METQPRQNATRTSSRSLVKSPSAYSFSSRRNNHHGTPSPIYGSHRKRRHSHRKRLVQQAFHNSRGSLNETNNQMTPRQFEETLLDKPDRNKSISLPSVIKQEKEKKYKEYEENPHRPYWSGKYDFMMNAMGYAIGLDNIWHFPYMCYRNGGGAFLIPYTLYLLFVGIPVFFLDISLGQFTTQGPLSCWQFAPIATGVGFGAVVISILVGIYYNVIIAYAIYYLFASFTDNLPWSSCDNSWNTPHCVTNLNIVNCSRELNLTSRIDGSCFDEASKLVIGLWNDNLLTNQSHNLKYVLPSQQYFNKRVTMITSGIDKMGDIQWRLVLCLLAAWTIVFLCTMNGVKSATKILNFTSLFPYLLLLILFFRAITLEGALDGIYYYMVPDFSRLQTAEVWKDAGNQIFFSLSASWGGLITLSSFNRFNNNTIRDTVVVSLCNFIMSLFAGFVIFAFLGHLALVMGTSVDKVVGKGMGLAFIVYPEAVKTMPASPLWSILFFATLIIIGLDSQFTMIETVVTSVTDKFPRRFRIYKRSHIFIFCSFCFLLGLPLTKQGGPYLLQLMDTYCEGWGTLVLALIKISIIGWLYGRPGFTRPLRFMKDIELMTGKPLSNWWRITWQYTAPILLAGTILFSWVDYKPARYGTYYYPLWAEIIGWLMTLSSVIWVPIMIIFLYCKHKRPDVPWYKTLHKLTEPTSKWGPLQKIHRLEMIRYIDDPSNVYIDVKNRIKYPEYVQRQQQLQRRSRSSLLSPSQPQLFTFVESDI